MGYVDAGYTIALVVMAAYAVMVGTRRSRLERRAADLGRLSAAEGRGDGTSRAGT